MGVDTGVLFIEVGNTWTVYQEKEMRSKILNVRSFSSFMNELILCQDQHLSCGLPEPINMHGVFFCAILLLSDNYSFLLFVHVL